LLGSLAGQQIAIAQATFHVVNDLRPNLWNRTQPAN